MRTTIDIDDDLTVDIALRDLVAQHQRAGILGPRGKVRWVGDLDESRAGHA